MNNYIYIVNKMHHKKFRKVSENKADAVAIIEAVVIIVVVIALAVVFRSAAEKFINEMFTLITQRGSELFD